MPRPLRIEYGGARYHVMSRGDRREDIVNDDRDRHEFLRALGEACQKTGWQVHAYCLMTNHFHFVIETPQPNLAVGMKWLLGTYTQRFNRRHGSWGHLFGSRYKAQLIDSRSPGYLRRACNYVHLNPARAGLVRAKGKLESFPWSSYPAYRTPRLRPSWLRVDRLMGEHGLQEDTARTRRVFERFMVRAHLDEAGDDDDLFRRGWKIGAEDFSDWLADHLARKGRRNERPAERSKTDTELAEAMVQKALEKVRWREIDLALEPKGHLVKAKIARQLRSETPMSRRWIADRLKIGSSSYLSALLASLK
jgi:REP element-mobilizing transposase RayT